MTQPNFRNSRNSRNPHTKCHFNKMLYYHTAQADSEFSPPAAEIAEIPQPEEHPEDHAVLLAEARAAIKAGKVLEFIDCETPTSWRSP